MTRYISVAMRDRGRLQWTTYRKSHTASLWSCDRWHDPKWSRSRPQML